MDGDEIIEQVQVDAAAGAVAQVQETVVAGDVAVLQSVAAVGGDLAIHAEQSETRHEEILEEQAVCQDVTQLLTAQVASLQSSLLSFQTSSQATSQAMLAELQTLNLRLSTGSPQQIPIVEPLAAVEPDGEDGPPAPPTPPQKRKPLKVI